MSPSEFAKTYGLESLTQVSELSGTSIQTLTNWFKNKPKLFKLVVMGAAVEVSGA